MSFLDIFRNPDKTSAKVAKARLLQLIVNQPTHPNINKLDLDKLQREILEVIGRYLPVNEHEVTVEVSENGSVLELNVVLPQELQ